MRRRPGFSRGSDRQSGKNGNAGPGRTDVPDGHHSATSVGVLAAAALRLAWCLAGKLVSAGRPGCPPLNHPSGPSTPSGRTICLRADKPVRNFNLATKKLRLNSTPGRPDPELSPPNERASPA